MSGGARDRQACSACCGHCFRCAGEDLLDHLVVIDEGDQLHHSPAVRADERIDFPHLFDELATLFRRDARGLVLGHVDDFHVVGVVGGGIRLVLGPLSPRLVSVVLMLCTFLFGTIALAYVYMRIKIT